MDPSQKFGFLLVFGLKSRLGGPKSTNAYGTIFKNNHFDYVDGAEGNYIRGAERFKFGGLG